MQIPILNGIVATNTPDLRISYPVNMVPVVKDSGINAGYLRPANGITELSTGAGLDRGGINWNGVCYRVMGSKLVTVSSNGVVNVLGDVGGSPNDIVTFDYSFDRLAIASAGNLYYWNGTLKQVTDPDLKTVIDFVWVDGYFMCTNGDTLVVTDLNDPFAVNPLKYGSSEADPDPVTALLKTRNEVAALNRYTIEIFDNVGGDFFPFRRIESAQLQKGCVGSHACCIFMDAIAFVGGGRNEAIGIYLGINATTNKISTQDIDMLLATYTEAQLSKMLVESVNQDGAFSLYVHLPDRTLVYDHTASSALQSPVWYVLSSSLTGFSAYRGRNFVYCYDKWMCGDLNTSKLGYLTKDVGSHFGDIVRWEFSTAVIYNESKGVIFNQLELVSLTGNVKLGTNPKIGTSYSLDGLSWSQNKVISVGTTGTLAKRLVWFQQGMMRNWRIQRFTGDSQAHLSFVRLEATLEPLAV